MATITNTGVELSQSWGVEFYDYKFDKKSMDFQDLMVAVAEKRAVAVEGEVGPMTTRIQTRNALLEDLGSALADLTAAEATLASDAKGTDTCNYSFDSGSWTTCERAGIKLPNDTSKVQKQELEYLIQMVKSKIDALNNAAQTDMSRLQSLVDRRDESYTTASTLMSAVSDTRANLIGNL